jgi:hypothetical protein
MPASHNSTDPALLAEQVHAMINNNALQRAPAPSSTAPGADAGWTRPYYGIQHFGYEFRHQVKGRWATVSAISADCVILALWSDVGPFHAEEYRYRDLGAARRDGERYALTGRWPGAVLANKGVTQ